MIISSSFKNSLTRKFWLISPQPFLSSQSLTVFISGLKHLLYLLLCQLLRESSEDHPELRPGDESLPLLVEHSVRLSHLVLGVRLRHLLHHHAGEVLVSEKSDKKLNLHTELGELHAPAAVNINLVDHVLHLGVRGVLAQGPHDGWEFLWINNINSMDWCRYHVIVWGK